MATDIDSLRNKQAIVRHSFNDLILIYINAHNFRKNNIGKWVFDCDSFYAFMPMWLKDKGVEIKKPNDGRKVLTDTIRHIDNFMPFEEWAKDSENARESMRRIF